MFAFERKPAKVPKLSVSKDSKSSDRSEKNRVLEQPPISMGLLGQKGVLTGWLQEKVSESARLEQIWRLLGKRAFFERLRSLRTSDPSVLEFIETELTEDDRWLARQIFLHGPETEWSRDFVFDMLRELDGAEANNASLRATLEKIFEPGSEDLWFAQNLQIYGPEPASSPDSRWPSDALENWRYARIAIATSKDELLARTKPPSSTRAEIERSLSPVVPTVTGALPTFQPNSPEHGNYEERIRWVLAATIDAIHQMLVEGRGREEHADPTKVHPLGRFEEIGNAAKGEVDKVFGRYASGPPFVGGDNLLDRWQAYDEAVFGTPERSGFDDTEKANLAGYFIDYLLSGGSADIRDINREHGVVITRTIPPPSGGEAEAIILARIRKDFATNETTRDKLLEIDRAWPAAANNNRGIVTLQLWKAPTDAENRQIFWGAFQTMIHEYLHTLAHPLYELHALGFGGSSAEYNTLIEGVDSLLTETVWANVSGRVSEPALRQAVEGAVYASQPLDPNVIPNITEKRYASYAQAKSLVDLVGIYNLYVAYFLGKVDLI